MSRSIYGNGIYWDKPSAGRTGGPESSVPLHHHPTHLLIVAENL